MEVYAVRQQIIDKSFDSFYIFAGDELEVMWTYVRRIASVSGKSLRYVDSFAEIAKKLSSSLVKTRACYVVRDDADLLSNEKLWDRLGTHGKHTETMLGENILILLVSNLDKRTKFYKRFKDTIVEFERLNDSLLTQYIQRKSKLTDRNCARLIEVCDGNYGRILSELDKIKMYGADDENATFQQFIEDGTIYQPPEDAVFKLSNAVIKRNATLSFALLDECKQYGEATLVIISVLYTAIKQLLQVQTCKGETERVTGLTGWQIRQVSEGLKQYKASELINALRRLRDAERGIKRGTVEESLAVEHVLCAIL